MKVLVAEDDPIARRFLDVMLTRWGYEVELACDGLQAWDTLQQAEPPPLVVLDWMMPGKDGVDICRQARTMLAQHPLYILMLTARGHAADIIEGLQAGADDYMTKPFHREELQARIRVGERIISLQQELARHIVELEQALSRVKQLQGLLPICSYCKKIRDDHDYWHQVENYLATHSEARFSHGICPECYESHVKPAMENFLNQVKAKE